MGNSNDYKTEVKNSLNKHIKKGKKVLEYPDELDLSLQEFKKEFRLWRDYATEMLKHYFDEETAKKFEIYVYPSVVFIGEDDDFDYYVKLIEDGLTSLESIRNTLDFLLGDKSKEKIEKIYSKKVFIVHGRDELLKEQVARFIKELKLIPIILHEQPSKGNTIIEKFEENSDVDYAVILLTPDDVGGEKKDIQTVDELKPRARQNVIFELGFFIGKLGRERVCALKKGNPEILTDFSGVLYISVDKEDWKLELIKELKSAGIPLDTDAFLNEK